MANKYLSKQAIRYYFLLLIMVIVTGISINYSSKHFKIDADLNHLVKQDAPWRSNLDHISDTFSKTNNSLIVVVNGDNLKDVETNVKALTDKFNQDPLFSNIYVPTQLAWFKQNGLWFLPQDRFNQFSSNLSQQLPSLLPLVNAPEQAQQPLYYGTLISALQSQDQQHLTNALTPLHTILTNNQTYPWLQSLIPSPKGPFYQTIGLSAHPQLDQKQPNKVIMERVKSIINQVSNDNVTVKVTGQTALDYDEIHAANQSVTLAGTVSLIGLILVLGFGIRSLRIILASYAAVLFGLSWTIAAGLLLVGSYNTISIVFLVMFIGLSVDFAIHFCLRIKEEREKSEDSKLCLTKAIKGSFTPLSLCALTSAIGFLGFYPTDYTGLAELGIISAAGMLMGLIATFVVIPTFFFFFGYPRRKTVKVDHHFDDLNFWLPNHYKTVIALTVIVGIVMGFGASHLRFDFSTLVLKSKTSESVQTLEELQQQGLGSSYQMMMLANSDQQAEKWKIELQSKPEVSKVLAIDSFIPKNMEPRKQQLLSTLSNAQPNIANPSTVQQFEVALNTYLSTSVSTAENKKMAEEILHWLHQTPQEQINEKINHQLLLPLSNLQQSLQGISHVKALTKTDLPNAISSRYLSGDNQLLIAYPAGDMHDVNQLDQFITAVQSVAPNATGRAVAEQEVGKIVISAFYQATTYSLSLIFLILLFALPYKRDAFLAFIPLTLTVISTMAIAYWTGQSLNMANIIVIPLIFGLGVDNGIHIVERFRAEGSARAFYRSSTPRAAILSSLTTMATFGALMLADHQGMYSIGFLLTIAITLLLFYSLTVLPALLFSAKKYSSK
ncbi:MMPL family transporter [Vibrio sp. SS-MA-C1-2]|uniref:MMPL family transporter n=1 Tax=Vibrio sp. SS-MA-C1-2 TaxID=2908646 RepID=UPI001F1C8D6B|nr:MMPL family transporter [Vibrio sp. SS-MA-C1-2]UJF17326.1 MMPL family transporter [Vibrio sp. SS-MA-C1-2]